MNQNDTKFEYNFKSKGKDSLTFIEGYVWPSEVKYKSLNLQPVYNKHIGILVNVLIV